MTDDNVNEELAPERGWTDELMEKYDGTRVKVAKVWAEEVEKPWDEKGVMLNDGETKKLMVFKVETESVGPDALGEPLTYIEEFSLIHLPNGKWQPSGHVKSNSRKFYDKMKINKFSEAVGKEIVIVRKLKQMGKNAGQPQMKFSL